MSMVAETAERLARYRADLLLARKALSTAERSVEVLTERAGYEEHELEKWLRLSEEDTGRTGEVTIR